MNISWFMIEFSHENEHIPFQWCVHRSVITIEIRMKRNAWMLAKNYCTHALCFHDYIQIYCDLLSSREFQLNFADGDAIVHIFEYCEMKSEVQSVADTKKRQYHTICYSSMIVMCIAIKLLIHTEKLVVIIEISISM